MTNPNMAIADVLKGDAEKMEILTEEWASRLQQAADILESEGWQYMPYAPTDGTQIMCWATDRKPGSAGIMLPPTWKVWSDVAWHAPEIETRGGLIIRDAPDWYSFATGSAVKIYPTHWQPQPGEPDNYKDVAKEKWG